MPDRSDGLPSRRPLDLAVVGHVVIDRFLHAPHLPTVDRTVPLRSQNVALGGTAGNIARAAARQGLRVGLVGDVGDDFPAPFRAILRNEGIDLRGLRTVPGVPSSTCFIVEDGRGGQMTLIDQGVFADGRPVRFDPEPVRRAAFAHLTTAPPEPLIELAERLAGGPRIAVDPAQEVQYRWDAPRLRRLLGTAEILFGNRDELARIVRLLDAGSVRRLVDWVPLVVATLGPDGAQAYSRAGSEHVPARGPRRLVQVTGAGDAFRGGFYDGWCRGEPLRACLETGVESAARWIEGGGSLAAPRRRAPRRPRP